MNVEIEDDDEPEKVAASKGVYLVSSRVAVASVALDRALGAAGRRLFKRASRIVTVIQVPTEQWVEPIRGAIRAINPAIKFATGHEKPKTRAAEGLEVAENIARGGSVVGVTCAPDRLLPDVLLSAVTHRFEVLPLTAKGVGLAMKRCLSGRTPASTKNLDLSALDFDLLCACMPMGITKVAAVERLSRATAKPVQPAGSTGPIYPSLDDAVEYGEARAWGLDLRADIADLRAKKLSWADIDRGAVLEGPPGSGKTTFARILGDACGLPVIIGSISELFASSEGNLDSVIKAQRKLFDEAAAAAPCILFIDELNALPDPAKISPRGRDWWLPVIYDFYLLLDSAMSSRDGIVVVGATNMIQDISPALLRPQRLERSLHIGIPDVAGLANVLRTHLREDLIGEDLIPMATAGQGATAAVAMDWVRAARRASRRAGRPMIKEDLMAQIIPADTRSEADRYRAAVHEAGHGVIGLALGEPLIEISIVRRGASGGRAAFDKSTETLFNRERMERHVTMVLGASAAEAEVFGSPSSGAGGSPDSDLAKATELMATLRSSYGMAGSLLWVAPDDVPTLLKLDPAFRHSVEADLRRLYADAQRLANQFRQQILMVADRLIREGQVSREVVAQLIRPEGPPKRADGSKGTAGNVRKGRHDRKT